MTHIIKVRTPGGVMTVNADVLSDILSDRISSKKRKAHGLPSKKRARKLIAFLATCEGIDENTEN